MVTVSSEYYPSLAPPWEGARLGPELETVNTLAAPEARVSPPMTVARALREHCNIPFESFFLATHLGGGKFAYFTGPRPISEDDIRKMFRREKFLQFQQRTPSRENLTQTYEDDYELDGGHASRASGVGAWQHEARGRKRPRRQGALRGPHDDADVPPVVGDSKGPLVIGDSDRVLAFYDHRFKCIQQTACKEIAKAFVKVIAPKKQANNPYTKRDASAPDWWPKSLGPGEKEGKVRHIEPDHQWKRERVCVLKHILRMVIDPKLRPPSVQRLGEITVAKLEAAAMESLSSFFSDTSKPKNAKKKPILKELFRVAKLEEKYLRGEIDGTTQIQVTNNDMVMDFCFDEDEIEDEESGTMDLDRPRADSVTSSQVSPTRTASLPLPPSLSPTSTAVHAMAAQFQTAPFLHDLPLRPSQYTPAGLMSSDLQEHYAYPDSGAHALAAHSTAAMQMHDLLAAGNPHQHPDTSRRSSIFTTTTAATPDFTAGPSPSSALYTHHPSPWSQSASPQSTAATAATTPETSSPLFAYAPAQHAHHHAHQHTQQHIQHHSQQQTHQHQQHQQQQGVHSLPLPTPLPALPPLSMTMAQHHHHQQQQQHATTPAAAYSTAGQYTQGYDHHHQHHQGHQQQGHGGTGVGGGNGTMFRGGSIHLSLQGH